MGRALEVLDAADDAALEERAGGGGTGGVRGVDHAARSLRDAVVGRAAWAAGPGSVATATVDGPLPDDTIAYTYDVLGRVVSRAINGVALALTYDALGRVTQELNALGTFGYGYDGPTGRLATVPYPNGQTSTYSYLPAGQDHRLQTIHHRLPNAATLSRFDPSTGLGVALSSSKGDYTYDAVGNILTWQRQAGSAAPERWRYGYDRADQLTSALQETTDPTPTVRAGRTRDFVVEGSSCRCKSAGLEAKTTVAGAAFAASRLCERVGVTCEAP